MNDAQLNIRIDRVLKDQFTAAVSRRNESVAQVIERFTTAYVRAGDEQSVTHLDGNLCPLSQLINGLATQAAAALAMRIAPTDQGEIFRQPEAAPEKKKTFPTRATV